jgi:lysophospholipase L1-like esterase
MGATMRSRLRAIAVNGAICIASTLGALAVCEIGVRIFLPQNPEFFDHRKIRRASAADPTLLENIPNSYHPGYVGVPVRINAYGLRGPAVQMPKPPRTIRIIGVGDSVTFGYGVAEEKTFLRVLENGLNRTAESGVRYEVLNAGVEGTGLDYYRHFVETTAPRLDPDLVLVVLCLNDIAAYSHEGAPAERPHAGAVLRSARVVSDFLLEHSALYMALYMRMKSLLYAVGILNINEIQGYNFLSLTGPSAQRERAWRDSFGIMSDIVALSRKGHYKLAFVVFPIEMQVSKSALRLYRDRLHVDLDDGALSGEPQRKIEEFCRQNGVGFIDLLSAFRTQDPSQLYLRNKAVSLDPVHPSILGNQIAGMDMVHSVTNQLPAQSPAPLIRPVASGN